MSTDTTKKGGAAVVVLALVIATALLFLAGSITKPAIDANEKEALEDSLTLATGGFDGYTDITDHCKTEGVTAVYRVKSGTGGEDFICVFSTGTSRGLTVRLLTAFSFDGIVSAVHLLSAEGTPYNAAELIENSGITAQFGGISYKAAATKIDGIKGAEGCAAAVVRGVNNAVGAVRALLDTEASEEVAE